MEKYYTEGEVIDNLKFGEVAIKVSGEENKSADLNSDYIAKSVKIGFAVHYDEFDGILRSVETGNFAVFMKHEENPDKFIIVSKEVYEKIKKQ